MAVVVASAFAQTKGSKAAYSQPYALDLTMKATATGVPERSTSQIVRIEGAPWLRFHIAEYDLGPYSDVTFTSLLDGGKQRLDAKSLVDWRNNTAYFNGDAVMIELHVTDVESKEFVRFTGVTVGVRIPVTPPKRIRNNARAPETICGTNDDRVASNDSRVGRVNLLNVPGNTSNPFCTAWIVSNGALLTAGHCVDSDFNGTTDPNFLTSVVEFNVPASLPNGTTVFSNPNSQYPVGAVAGMGYDGPASALGRDWAVFSVGPNSNTGVLPHAVQSFFRMSSETPIPSTESVTVTGYGVDNTPVGTTGGENAQTRTLQTHSALFIGEIANGGDFALYYQVDTTSANSGSPVIWDNTGYTIGIHTNGGCTVTDGFNAGTSFEHDPLENALQNFPGPNGRYVDSMVYPNIGLAPRDGSVFRPFATVANGITATPTGGTLTIVPGTYTGGIVFDKAMTVRVPVGTATIGP
jgi:trimeric autotransporter adhesin